MIKHKYLVFGIDSCGFEFTSLCIDYNISKAIQQYKNKDYSVHAITIR